MKESNLMPQQQPQLNKDLYEHYLNVWLEQELTKHKLNELVELRQNKFLEAMDQNQLHEVSKLKALLLLQECKTITETIKVLSPDYFLMK